MEYSDVYDAQRRRTGRLHLRGTPWGKGEYGLIVCVWVYDGKGRVLMTKRAPEKTFAGTWENSGGAAQAGETSLQAVARELFEETGIRARQQEFELIGTRRNKDVFFDFYCLKRDVPLEQVVLLPGETVEAGWFTFREVHQMIRRRQICRVIARQYLRQEKLLKERLEPGYK
ncbi:MAG: NUDIX hydrolase [Oscillospiraceae bacterium]|nr:NUDIX hydrolase [Oscillospiraceae bacterium]